MKSEYQCALFWCSLDRAKCKFNLYKMVHNTLVYHVCREEKSHVCGLCPAGHWRHFALLQKFPGQEKSHAPCLPAQPHTAHASASWHTALWVPFTVLHEVCLRSMVRMHWNWIYILKNNLYRSLDLGEKIWGKKTHKKTWEQGNMHYLGDT